MNRRSTYAVIGAAVVLALAAGAFAWWRAAGDRAAWRRSVPPAPELASFPGELERRVAAAADQAATRDVAALGQLGLLYHANGFLREAEQAYGGLERFDESNPRWPHLRAHILAGVGRLDEALPRWRRVVALAPEYVPARLRMGDVLLKTNQAGAAAQAYAEALQLAPQDPYALLGLARCELQLGRLTAARERLQETVKARPEFGAGWSLLATIYERIGNSDAANSAGARADALPRFREMPDEWFDALLDDCYDVYRLRVAAATALTAGDEPAAERWLVRARTLAPEAAAVARDLGKLYARRRDWVRARKEFEWAVERAPADDSNHLELVTACVALGDDPAAARALTQALAHCPRSAALWFAQARYCARLGQTEEALAALLEVRRLQPDKPDAYHEMASTLFGLGRDAEGIAALEAVLEHVPDHVPTLLALAQRAIETGNEERAEQWFQRARSIPAPTTGEWTDLTRKFRERFGRMPVPAN